MASLIPHLDALPDAQQRLWPALRPAAGLKALVYFQGGDLETLSANTRSALISAAAAVGSLPVVTIVSRSLALPESLSGSSDA